MTWNYSPRKIEGSRVSIEPLTMALFDETCKSLIPDPNGWYSVMFGLNTPEAYKKEFEIAEDLRKSQNGVGYAIRDSLSGEIAGISFFLRMDDENRSLEIGTTNIALRFRNTYVNSSAKFLMLQEAFENLKCIRVSFRVDEENKISRAAVERIGGKYGGLLRSERILPDGRIRNYCFYSIIDSEWPDVKLRLEKRTSSS